MTPEEAQNEAQRIVMICAKIRNLGGEAVAVSESLMRLVGMEKRIWTSKTLQKLHDLTVEILALRMEEHKGQITPPQTM